MGKIGKYRTDRDPQYYLKNSRYKYLPLSPIQKTKINAALAAKQDPSVFLSPTQRQWLNEEWKESLYDLSLDEAWMERS